MKQISPNKSFDQNNKPYGNPLGSNPISAITSLHNSIEDTRQKDQK